MSQMEDAERGLAKYLKELPQEKAVEILCGAVAIAYGDTGLEALCAESKRHLEIDKAVEHELR